MSSGLPSNASPCPPAEPAEPSRRSLGRSVLGFLLCKLRVDCLSSATLGTILRLEGSAVQAGLVVATAGPLGFYNIVA